MFLLCSLYLQNVLGWGPLTTGLAFVPLALSAGIGSHAAGHLISKHGVRGPLAGSFAVAAVGMFLLSRVGEHGSYVTDVLPGMLIAGVALGVATVSVSMAILTGTREEESGMISGLNSTGHEIGGTLGIAIFSTIAAGSGAILGPEAASGSATRSWSPPSSLASQASWRWRFSLVRSTSLRSWRSTRRPCLFTEPMAKTNTQTEASAPKRRRADAERNIAAITQAALEALADDADASMADIARRAGVVRATIYMHFPTREALLDAVMEHSTAQVAEATRQADPERGNAKDALERVLLATWEQLSQFHNVLQINISRLSAKELHRRHLPITSQFIPLLERGQAEGVFRSDVSALWLIAVLRAIVHVASTELQAGRLTQAEVERTMLTTAMAAISP